MVKPPFPTPVVSALWTGGSTASFDLDDRSPVLACRASHDLSRRHPKRIKTYTVNPTPRCAGRATSKYLTAHASMARPAKLAYCVKGSPDLPHLVARIVSIARRSAICTIQAQFLPAQPPPAVLWVTAPLKLRMQPCRRFAWNSTCDSIRARTSRADPDPAGWRRNAQFSFDYVADLSNCKRSLQVSVQCRFAPRRIERSTPAPGSAAGSGPVVCV